MMGSAHVVPAPGGTAISSSGSDGVFYEALAPGGGHLPAQYIPFGAGMPPMGMPPMGMPPMAMSMPMPAASSAAMPYPYGVPGYMPGGVPMMGYGMHGAVHPHASAALAATGQGHEHGHAHGHGQPRFLGELKHAPKEADGKVPYELPRPLANELGFQKLEDTKQLCPKPTIKRAEVEGDVIEIEATGASRWELELQDEGWDKPILAVVDSSHKKATFRLAGAENRSMTVRVCTVSIDGKQKNWTAKQPIVKKPPPPEPEPAPVSTPATTPATAPAAAAASG